MEDAIPAQFSPLLEFLMWALGILNVLFLVFVGYTIKAFGRSLEELKARDDQAAKDFIELKQAFMEKTGHLDKRISVLEILNADRTKKIDSILNELQLLREVVVHDLQEQIAEMRSEHQQSLTDLFKTYDLKRKTD